MGDKAETVWGEVYERVRRRVLAGLILALAFAGVFDGLANYDRLGDEYQPIAPGRALLPVGR